MFIYLLQATGTSRTLPEAKVWKYIIQVSAVLLPGVFDSHSVLT